MKLSFRIIRCLFLLTLIVLPVFAQQNEAVTHFAKDDLVFDYPATTKLEDLSNANGQHLVMLAGGTGAQIMIISRFDKIASTEQLNLARHDVADAFVEKMWLELQKLDPKMTRDPGQIEIAGNQAPGVRMRALLNNEPGSAEVYSTVLGQRLVLVTLIGSDKEIAAAAKDWAMVRSSLQVGTGASP